MITIESIQITEFRGIRDLKLDFRSKSFLVWGPNGSGKSGVVDAIDFVLTGELRRISGKGFQGITLAKYGPHVASRDDAGAASVAVTVRESVSGKTATLTRNVSSPEKIELDPDHREVRDALELAGRHPEITLSRREIIDYIVTQPTERAKQVQQLLKLDRISETRALLRSTQSKLAASEKEAEQQVVAAEDALKRHLDVLELNVTPILEVVNAKREILGLARVDSLDGNPDVSGGITESAENPRFDKNSALRDIGALQTAVADLDDGNADGRELAGLLRQLHGDSNMRALLDKREIVSVGLSQLEGPFCPLCDIQWPSLEELKSHLEEKHAESKRAGELKSQIQTLTEFVVRKSRELRAKASTIVAHASSYGPSGMAVALNHWQEDLVAFETRLASEAATDEISRLESSPFAVPDELLASCQTLEKSVGELPDLSAAAQAATFLSVAQDRMNTVHQLRSQRGKSEDALKLGQVAYETYCEVADSFLSELYESVESEFSDFYRELNSGDEDEFKAMLTPSSGKLKLEVDFYNHGLFPPAAYHSEGHQDGMGVCLYLALIEKVLGENMGLVVLDDVVTSVDRSHRRQFCELLKSRFPDVQFVLTTHDEIWASQMFSAGLVLRSQQARFYSWSVEDGPIYDDGTEVWDRIQDDLDKNDVPSAAGRLRRYLEASLSDLAERTRSKVLFRADARHDFGELFGGVVSEHKNLLDKALKSAQAWKNTVDEEKIVHLQQARKEALVVQQQEQWMVNLQVHYNEWATLSANEFEPVVKAWREFFSLFECENPECGSWISVSMDGLTPESLRCKCGIYNLNLQFP